MGSRGLLQVQVPGRNRVGVRPCGGHTGTAMNTGASPFPHAVNGD